MYLVFLLVRAYAELRSMPYFGELRVKNDDEKSPYFAFSFEKLSNL